MEPFIGQIVRLPLPYTFNLAGYLPCDGRLYPTASYPELFGLIGYIYGGADDQFGVPDLRGRVPIGAGTAASGTYYPLGAAGGQESVTLQAQHYYPHSHSVPVVGGGATTNVPTDVNTFADAAVGIAGPQLYGPYQAGQQTPLAGGMVTPAIGNSQPHENRQPFVGMAYWIAVEGVYPPIPN